MKKQHTHNDLFELNAFLRNENLDEIDRWLNCSASIIHNRQKVFEKEKENLIRYVCSLRLKEIFMNMDYQDKINKIIKQSKLWDEDANKIYEYYINYVKELVER